MPLTTNEVNGSKDKSGSASLKDLYRDLIDGLHILHYTGVLDAYGHLSVRHPHKPDVYIMSRNMAPATVTSASDLVEYRVEDAEPVHPGAPKGFKERFIHSEVFKAHPSVQAVVHSHAESVVPYTINGVPLKPVYHMSAFMGLDTPIWDIGPLYKPGELRDMLVVSMQQGASLAGQFHKQGKNDPRAIVLQRGHGLTIVADSIPLVVARAIFTMKNAGMQTAALTSHAAFYSGVSALTAPSIQYLSEEECEGGTDMLTETCGRPWGLYTKEVRAHPFYKNEEAS